MTASHCSLVSFVISPVVAVLLHEQAVAQDAGVVDEAVEAAHRAVRPVDERADVGLVRDVELAACGPCRAGPARLGERGEAVLVDVAGGDLSAGLGEPASEVRAHALGATGDDDLQSARASWRSPLSRRRSTPACRRRHGLYHTDSTSGLPAGALLAAGYPTGRDSAQRRRPPAVGARVGRADRLMHDRAVEADPRRGRRAPWEARADRGARERDRPAALAGRGDELDSTARTRRPGRARSARTRRRCRRARGGATRRRARRATRAPGHRRTRRPRSGARTRPMHPAARGSRRGAARACLGRRRPRRTAGRVARLRRRTSGRRPRPVRRA